MKDWMDEGEGRCRCAVGRKWPGLKFALSKKPYDLMIFMSGTNDIGHGAKPELIYENITQIVKASKETVPEMDVIVVGIPESAFLCHNSAAMERRNLVNAKLKENPENLWTYADCPVKFQRTSGLFENDGLHFSPAGYQAFASGILEKVYETLSAKN